ncbi:membrane-bound lytic murein transglycosylase F [Bizionia echini]|uniref:Membrane-bound lytic murein transglycosylase F n=1 Tax=Bizionia echini TaxID=649333 RepID=A0A1I4ZYL8_9FLAO|nr:transporter substrate-binding domain-containing protein [Bizionia echini]SFN55292.1 membrane-bound lytic murein transglycosylase F [Bizionia echini]
MLKIIRKLFIFSMVLWFISNQNVLASSSALSNFAYGNQIKNKKQQFTNFKKAKQKLKVLVVYSSTSYFLYRGKTMGFEYELLERLSDMLDMDLEVVVSENIDSLIPDLLSGKADLIAHGITITEELKKTVLFTDYIYSTHQVLIQKKPHNWRQIKASELEKDLIRELKDLNKDTVWVRELSSYKNQLNHLNNDLGYAINIQVLDGSYSTDEIIDMVNRDIIKYTVADDNLAKINTTNMPDLDVVTPISGEQQIAWVVRPDSKELLNRINEQLHNAKKNTDFYVIYNKYFKNKTYYKKRLKSPYYSLKHGKISPYDKIIKKEAARIGWDWRLLSSVIYQESRFNPNAKSWSGAVGLMQMMPETAKAHGLYDPTNPKENIKAGATYLQQIFNQFKEIENTEQRIKFTLASYNSGYGHVLDAQRLAESKGKDKYSWDNHVESMMLELSKPEIYRKAIIKHGYARGVETYNYIKDIFQRYDNYQNFIKS